MESPAVFGVLALVATTRLVIRKDADLRGKSNAYYAFRDEVDDIIRQLRYPATRLKARGKGKPADRSRGT